MIADLDTLLTALYVELTDRIIPSRGLARSGPGRPPAVTDAELACLAVAQVLLRYDDERHWLRAAPKLIGHLFPRLLGQGEYNLRLRQLAPLAEAALRHLAYDRESIAKYLLGCKVKFRKRRGRHRLWRRIPDLLLQLYLPPSLREEFSIVSAYIS